MVKNLNRTTKQQEYRDNLAHTIKDLCKYRKGTELSEALLDDEMLTRDYVESLGNGRKLNKEISEKWLKNKDFYFVISHLESFDLDNNRLAKKLLHTNHGARVLTFFEHFMGLDKEVADMLINEGCIEEVRENINSFDNSAKEYIRSFDEKNVDSKKNGEIEEYVEEVKVRENLNIDYKHRNMSQEVEDYFNKRKFEKPFFEIEFDGKKMYLTKLQPVIGYEGFVGFIEINGKYEIRYFIRSGSESLRRCCPGYREQRVVSKLNEFNDGYMEAEVKNKYLKAGFNYTGNFSYERSTMVDFRFGQELENLYLNTLCKNGKYYSEYYNPETRKIEYHNGATNADYSYSKNFDESMANRCIKMSKEIYIIDDFSDKFKGLFKKHTIQEVKDTYRVETLGIDINSLNLIRGKKYQYWHNRLHCYVDVEVCNAKMHGKEIEIFFSHTQDEPDLVWIDNIQYKDQPMNSYGIPAKQINAGWITKKPMDYPEQCPEYDKLPNAGGYSDYKDIRSLYQGSPLIKRYKELSSI